MVIAKEAVYTSVVLAVGEPRLTPPALHVPGDTTSIEQRLDATVRVGEGMSDRGRAILLDVQRHRLQGILAPGRIEARCSEDASGKFPLMGTLLVELVRLWGAASFDRVGYNFGYLVRVNEPAIRRIAHALFNEADLSAKLSNTILGVGTWLWVSLGGGVLWLRLEPRNRDRQTDWVSIDANFEEQVPSPGALSEQAVADNLSTKQGEFQSLLERIGLW